MNLHVGSEVHPLKQHGTTTKFLSTATRPLPYSTLMVICLVQIVKSTEGKLGFDVL